MQDHSNTPEIIPYGYCHCGCGEKTTVAAQSLTSSGWVNGQPIRYIHGHNAKLPPANYQPGDKKHCFRCNKDVPFEAFGKNSTKRDGLNAWCKPCAAEYHREYYSRNSEKHGERTSRWRKNNVDAARQIKKNRVARERNGIGKVTLEEWQSILSQFGGRCAKCGEGDNIEMDHVVPLSKGGKNTADNVQPLCRRCNRKKSTKTEDYRGKMYAPVPLPFDRSK